MMWFLSKHVVLQIFYSKVSIILRLRLNPGKYWEKKKKTTKMIFFHFWFYREKKIKYSKFFSIFYIF